MNGNGPEDVRNLLTMNEDVRTSTRKSRCSKLNLICPKYVRQTEGGRSFMVSVTKMWKELPMDIRKKSTVTSF